MKRTIRIFTLFIFLLLVMNCLSPAIVQARVSWCSTDPIVSINGTQTHINWSVLSDGASEYKAEIKVYVPEEAEVEVISQSPNETVTVIYSDDLEQKANWTEVLVVVKVEQLEGDVSLAKKVLVSVEANGHTLAQKAGDLGSEIELEVNVPVDEEFEEDED